MNTVENNRLIDVFMESKGEEILHKDQWGRVVWGDYKPHSYHSDWNLLMGVVEKIESLDYIDYHVNIEGFSTFIHSSSESFKTIHSVSENSKKESVWYAILSLIKCLKD